MRQLPRQPSHVHPVPRTRMSLALGRARSVAPRGCAQATHAATTRPVLGRAPRLGQRTSRCGPSRGRTRRRPHQPSLVHSAPMLGRARRWAGHGVLPLAGSHRPPALPTSC
ncbi:hypothetical protein PIB30_099637 [Stylosanthes scabra]|uniref:Uncharacterized protein n=1 Tax=Stylosanthes scabra TaxID=79078 RepID=A0ABU6SX74_9FABA|nr:hypothetical protein [Stylosanthes scabra]